MTHWLYQLLLACAYPLVRLRLKLRARREPAYGERVEERFGQVPDNIPSGVLWFHTVSAGETIAAVGVIEQLLLEAPDRPVLVTTMTPTGSQQVTQRLGDRVAHCYAPYDFPAAVGRFFAAVQPVALVLMETELWPNIVRTANRLNVPVLLINGRLSARSARGYARIAGLSRALFAGLTAVACQTAAHRDRFVALGADPRRVQVAGSVKFDVRLPRHFDEEVAELKGLLGIDHTRPVWIAASTHPGEDEPVLDAFAALRVSHPTLCLLLVPRHPVRAPELIALVQARGMTVVTQSACVGGHHHVTSPDVVVGDVMGSLLQLYGLAMVAFVGGSLVPVGGHNPIEPALCDVPVVSGPQQFNFTDVCEAMAEGGGLVTVHSAAELTEAVDRWLSDDIARRQAAAAGSEVVLANRGATDRVLALVRAHLPAASPLPDAAEDSQLTDCSG